MSEKKKNTQQDKEWQELVKLFRKRVIKYKTILQVANELDLNSLTVTKILKDGHKPNFLCRIKIEEWVNQGK